MAENTPIVGEFIQSCIDTLVDIFSSIVNAVDEVIQVVNKILRIIKLVNAFIAGVINECIEMTAGLMDLAALALTLTNKVEREKVKESLENILESYRKEPSKIITQLKEAFADLQERYSSDKSGYQIAYQLGEDAVTVVAWIELVNGIIKALKNLPKTFSKVKAWAEKSIQRVKAIEFSKTAEQLKVLRFKYIDRTYIRAKWRIFTTYSELSNNRILALQQLRQEYGLMKKNVATLKIKAITKEGIIIIKKYNEHSGKGKKIPGSVGAPQIKPQRDFLDPEFDQRRWLDSENKILIAMDEDLEPYTIIQMTMTWESTFTPCTICKREILIRKEFYNAKVTMKSPKFKNKKGKKVHVITSADYSELLKQLK